MKQLIITADDFGYDNFANEAIMDAFNNGILTSSCLMANMEGFEDAISKIKSSKKALDIGVHLNIIEGKSLAFDGTSSLTDKNGNFNNGFIGLLIKSFDEKFLAEVEKEFRYQIEKIKNENIDVTYINSHVHTHSIPNIFKLVCKLMKEHDIKAIRTQKENFYIAKPLKRHFNLDYFINIIKNILLNFFSLINKNYLKKTNFTTNDNFIGVLYTANMDKSSILDGLKNQKGIIEAIAHPTLNKNKPKNYIEYQTFIDNELKNELLKQNIKLINWKDVFVS